MLETEERVSLLERLLAEFVELSKSAVEEIKTVQSQTELEIRQLSKKMDERHAHTMIEINQLGKEMDERHVHAMIEINQLGRRLEDSDERLGKRIDEVVHEMKESNSEMREFSREMKESNRKLNSTIGEISRKQGTMVEDLIHPSLPRIIEERFGLHVTDFAIRRKMELADGSIKEYDAVARSGQYVFVNSTKSTLRDTDAGKFEQDLGVFRLYFPEYAECKLIGVLASLHVDKGILTYLERQGFLVLAVGDALMEIMNSHGFKPKEW
ncbi:MAG: hypothetical protein HQL06_12735 [Nitrospirae bacterium]|nr:hypothetical protein [Nitrospirota bacterium]